MARKNNRLNPAHPTPGDLLLPSAEQPDHGEPPAQLNSARNLLVLDQQSGDLAGKTKAMSLSPVEGLARAATVEDAGVVFGQLGGRITSMAVPKASAATPKDSEPYRPEWSGVAFAPRASVASRRPALRRRNGARVRPEYVFPPDGRQVYYPNAYPWRAVGRIFVWDNAAAPNWAWWGSAALVSRNAILTASHVVPWGAGSWKALFVPAYYDGASVYGANAASWVQTAHGYADHDQGDDMAVMRLAQPLGDWLGYFGYKTYNDDWEDGNYWTLAGYPFDVANGQRPSANYWFPITDDDNDGAGVELEYKADTNGGNSGGPVFGWWDNKPYVIGTHSGGEDNFGEPKQNVAAGGSALSSLIAWARSNW